MPRPPASVKKLVEDKRTLLHIVKSQPCADCGKTLPPECMDLDHLGDKLDTVSRMTNRTISITTFIREIAKCEVTCSNCHRIRTFGGRPSG